MATISAIDLITRSMRLAGILESEETPTAGEANDALGTLNDLLETWGTESLTVFATLEQQFTLIPNQGAYTIGTAGNFNGTRPIRILSAYTRYPLIGGIDYPMEIISDERYAEIVLKSQTSQIPLLLNYDGGFPLATLTLWPVPSLATQIFLLSEQPFAALANTAATISYPPGYSRALRYALAVELAGEYGVQLRPDVVDISQSSKAAIKRVNKVPALASFDAALLADTPVSTDRFLAGL